MTDRNKLEDLVACSSASGLKINVSTIESVAANTERVRSFTVGVNKVWKIDTCHFTQHITRSRNASGNGLASFYEKISTRSAGTRKDNAVGEDQEAHDGEASTKKSALWMRDYASAK